MHLIPANRKLPHFPHCIQMPLLGIEAENNNTKFPEKNKLLLISRSSLYIIKDFKIEDGDNTNKRLDSEKAIENSEFLLDQIPFSKIKKFNFGKFKLFEKKNEFPIKISVYPKMVYFLEFTKTDYIYIRKLFIEISNLQATQSSKKFKFSQNLKDELYHIDSTSYIPNLFKTIVVDTKTLNENQFQKVVFNKTDLNLSVEHRGDKKTGGFMYMAKRVRERIKKGRFKVDYVIPDIWKQDHKFVIMTENDQDMMHNVMVPHFEKVLDEGKEKIVFQKEDKELLLGYNRSLNEVYYNSFGPENENFEIQVKFWDKFFENEFKNESLICGNDKNEKEKRVNLSEMLSNRLEYLEHNENIDGADNNAGTKIYKQSILEIPNIVLNPLNKTN
jgi:hypothetical protein